jgi:P-type Ca2+ transporter type 2C
VPWSSVSPYQCRSSSLTSPLVGIGLRSQWGKIKANLVSESVNTPLQDKLEDMAGLVCPPACFFHVPSLYFSPLPSQIGYIGSGVAGGTFLAMVASIWLRHNGEDAIHGILEAFIIAVTIIVVAIPEGLPLAVTISLAYSTKKMYEDQCFIRVLAACETMGNATTLCSDKTGTLTENRMTVVEAMFGDKKYSQMEFETCVLSEAVKTAVSENSAINRTAYLIEKDAQGAVMPRPHIVGNKTEGALMLMVRKWGADCETIKKAIFNESRDKIFAFNSSKKRSTAVIHRSDGTIRFYVKGESPPSLF